MGDQTDRESKTEEASPRRVEEALEKGNIPFSREVNTAAILLTIAIGFPMAGVSLAATLSSRLASILDKSAEFRLELTGDVQSLLWLVGGIVTSAIWPLLLILIVAGLLSSLLQNPPRFSLDRVKPDFAKVSLSNGFARILGAQGRAEFAKALVKTLALLIVLLILLQMALAPMLQLIGMRPSDVPAAIVSEVSNVFMIAGLLTAVLAAADVVWVRYNWRSRLRMSKQELKDEARQSEGDPIERARRRSIARDRARRRMMSAVPQATLVIANPTHYAVALRFVHGETSAPVVMAKGIDHIALRIRAIAEKNGIPVVENKVLARSLYASVKPGQSIPPEFYRAIAEIIMFLMSKQPNPIRTDSIQS